MAKDAKPPANISDSPFMRVRQEALQAPTLRRGLIAKLEEAFKAKVVVYFSSFSDASITDDDAEMLENLLAAEHQGGPVLLVLNSPGGQALAAERIVNVCRAYSENRFEVLVPHMAKSAATMICFGASKIHLSPTAELGPVDPQVAYKDDLGSVRWISADEYVRSYNNLIKSATDGKAKRIEPYLQQLNRYDSRFIEQLISHQKLSEDISVRLLAGSMMKGMGAEKIRKKIKVFLSQSMTSSHGRMINQSEAHRCGLKTARIDLHSEVWNHVWELYVRANWAVSDSCRKVIESSQSAMSF